MFNSFCPLSCVKINEVQYTCISMADGEGLFGMSSEADRPNNKQADYKIYFLYTGTWNILVKYQKEV